MEKHCCHSTLTEENCREILSQYGIHKTKSKISILMELSQSHEPMSAQQIFEKLESCDLSTVFRTLTQFKDKGIISEVNLNEGFLRYELTVDDHQHKHDDHHHHHYVICRNCKKIAQIQGCDISIFEKAIASLGFTQMEHRLEFSGLCSKCSKEL